MDPYARKLIHRGFFAAKRDVTGTVVVVLDGLLENRSLQLIQPISRACATGTVIELIATDEQGILPGSTVNAIAYIAFVELTSSGVILVGDDVLWNGSPLGVIAGYDDTHMPNHQNVIVAVDRRISGKDLGLRLDDGIVLRHKP
jgi:hypothetical protein